MGYQIAGDPVPEGEDQSGAKKETAAPDASAATALAVDPGNPGAVPQRAGDKPARTDGKVTLAPVPPLGSVTLPPLEEGGEGIVIGEGGTEVDADTAERAHQAAERAGFKLREVT